MVPRRRFDRLVGGIVNTGEVTRVRRHLIVWCDGIGTDVWCLSSSDESAIATVRRVWTRDLGDVPIEDIEVVGDDE